MKRKQYLVVGLGRFGESVAQHLTRLGHEVLAVDKDEELVESIAPHVTQAVQADITDEGTLAELGIHEFDAAVVSIGAVQDSVLAVALLKEAGIEMVIAKALDELHGRVLQKVGADRVVFPEREMGARVAKGLALPHVNELMELKGDLQIVEIDLPEKWADKSIVQVDVRRRFGLNILAIHRQDDFMVYPEADTMLKRNDRLVVVGCSKDIEAVAE